MASGKTHRCPSPRDIEDRDFDRFVARLPMARPKPRDELPCYRIVDVPTARALARRSCGDKRLPAFSSRETTRVAERIRTRAGVVVVAYSLRSDRRLVFYRRELVGSFYNYVSVMVFARDLDRVARNLPPRDPSGSDPDDVCPTPVFVTGKPRTIAALLASVKDREWEPRVPETAADRKKARDRLTKLFEEKVPEGATVVRIDERGGATIGGAKRKGKQAA